MGGLYDKKFVDVSDGLHGFAIEMGTNSWRETYSLASHNVRVMSLPGIFRAVVLGDSEGEIIDIFHMLMEKVYSLDAVDVPFQLPLLRKVLYWYLDDKVVGEAWKYVVSSTPDISLDDEESSLVVVPTPDPMVELKEEALYGALVMKLWFVTIGKTEDILYLWGLKDAFSPEYILRQTTVPDKIHVPHIIQSGVFLERLGNTFILGSWLLVPPGEQKKAQDFMDHMFSITSIDFVPGQLVKKATLNYFKDELYSRLSITFNRPTARLLKLMDITAPMGSKLLPSDIVALVPRMDLIGFKRVLRLVRTSPVKDIVVVGVE